MIFYSKRKKFARGRAGPSARAKKMAWDALDRKPNIKEITGPTPEPICVARQETSNESSRSGDGVDFIEVDSVHESTR